MCYYKLNKFSLSLQYLTMYGIDNIQDPLTLLCIIEIIERKEKNEENNTILLKSLNLMINLDYNNINFRYKLAGLYVEMQKFKEAIEQYKFILELDNESLLALKELAKLYNFYKDTRNYGIICYKLGLRMKINLFFNDYNPDDESSPVNICLFHLLEANKHLSHNIDILLDIADIYRLTDRYKEALNYLNLALQINNKDYKT